MAAFLDNVRFTPTAGGTTDWTFFSVVTGYQSPAAAGVFSGTNYRYFAISADGTQWEIGVGAYNTSTGVLSRTTVLYNSSGTGTTIGQSGAGTKINFSAAPSVAIVGIKEDLISIEEANSFTTTQQSQAMTNIGAAPYDAEAYNNILINGGMEIDQANGGGAVAYPSGGQVTYNADGWIINKGGTMALSGQQVADAPPGFSNSLKVTVTTADASLLVGEFVEIFQKIEGYRTSRLQFGTAAALSVTLGFWTKIHRTGTYSGSLVNAAGTRSYPFTFTQNVADTWEYKTVTIPGDVAGTWVGNTNASAMNVNFCIASGTTFTTAAGSWAAGNFIGATGTTNGVAATTDVFQITGVTLLPGTIAPTAAQSVLLKRSYDLEIMLCRRYFYNGVPPVRGVVAGSTTSTAVERLGCLHPVTMRAVPTLTMTTALPVFEGIAATTLASIGANESTTTALEFEATATAALSSGHPAIIFQGGGGNLNVDARL